MHVYAKKLKKERPARIGLLTRFYAFLSRRKIVRFVDFHGEVNFTLRREPVCIICGKYHCPVFWATDTGDFILEDGGKIGKDSHGSYIEEWEYA